MSRISSLSRRASPVLTTSKDENSQVTPSVRISRSGSRLAQQAKDLKSVWDGPGSLPRRASGEDTLFKRRSPLSTTTNTVKSHASGLLNESAETKSQVYNSEKDRRSMPVSPTRQPSATAESMPRHFVSPVASSESDVTTLDVESTQSPRPSSESVRGSPPRRRAELHIDVEAANSIGPQSSSLLRHGHSGLDAPSAHEAIDSEAHHSANKGAALGGKGAQQEHATQPASLRDPFKSGDVNNPPSAENSLFSQAMSAVLQERLGITSLAQLSETEAKALVHGDLSSWVAQYLSQLAQTYAVSPESLAGLDAIEDAQSPTPPLMLSPPPFPADALPSEIQLEQNTNLYLSGLSESMTDDHLLRLGTLYGDVISHKAIINSETGLCKGYGFVMYAKARDAAIAMVELQRQGFLTSFARHESFSAKLRSMADDRSTNVYVSNLPLDLDDQQLAALVQPHSIVSRRILSKPDGTSRGVGFIRFQTREIAQDCIDRLHGKRLRNHPHPLQARFADSETQKRLKQDATLRKVYADLDMGKLQTPAREGSSTDAHREDDSDPSQASLQARPLPKAADRIIASSRAASNNEVESNHSRGPGWKSPLAPAMPTWSDGRLASSNGRFDSLGDVSLWPSFNSSTGLGPRNVSPSLDPLYWRRTGVASPGMSPSTSSGSITAMASMFPERSNSVTSPHQVPRPHHRLNDGRRDLLPGAASHSEHGRGSGLPGPSAMAPRYGWPGITSRVSQGSGRLSPLLGHQTPGLLGQQGMDDAAGGQRMYSATSLEGLSGLEALRAAGFIKASEQKAAIPIVDPTTRQSAYEMIHRARHGWQSQAGEGYRGPLSPPSLHGRLARNADGDQVPMMTNSISLNDLLRGTPSGRQSHQMDGMERESEYERRPGMSNSHSFPTRLERAAEGASRGPLHESRGRWERAGASSGRRDDVG